MSIFFWGGGPSTWSGLQEEAKPGFRKSQVAREALCSDLLIVPQALCVGETLFRKGLSWPSLCASQVLDKGTKRAHRWQCLGHPESPIILQRVTTTWSWDKRRSDFSKPRFWGTYALHPGFPWFSLFPWFP